MCVAVWKSEGELRCSTLKHNEAFSSTFMVLSQESMLVDFHFRQVSGISTLCTYVIDTFLC
jgi:hypothetical protein